MDYVGLNQKLVLNSPIRFTIINCIAIFYRPKVCHIEIKYTPKLNKWHRHFHKGKTKNVSNKCRIEIKYNPKILRKTQSPQEKRHVHWLNKTTCHNGKKQIVLKNVT